jgi:phosphatidylinositol alpha-1,6-mannosyltransferase
LKTRILILCHHWKQTGGIERLTVDIAKSCLELGYAVEVWAAHDNEPASISGIDSLPLAPTSPVARYIYFRYLEVKKLRELLERFLTSYDFIIVNHVALLKSLNELISHDRKLRPKVIAWVYGLEVWGQTQCHQVQMLQSADAVVSISRFTAAEVKKILPVARIRVIPPSVDTLVFCPPAQKSVNERHELLTVGRMSTLERYKGHESLLRVLPRLMESIGDDVHLTVIGDGDDRRRLELLSHILGVDDCTTFRGQVPLHELVSAYQTADLFIMPSVVERSERSKWTGEGFGIVYLEAQACSCPVIAGSDGGAPEALIAGQTGLVVNPHDQYDIMQAIGKLLKDKDLAISFGHEGRKLVERSFSRTRFTDSVGMMLTELGKG